ncbi:MAG TPA: energy transducer TonB [Rhizomicrobium sp.]|nr:energy transducer TonB [Rhizomicrobium sp.]
MERPSHITFNTSHMSRRLPLFALAAFLQVGAVCLIMSGLGHSIPFIEGDLHVFDFKQPTIDKMPPPDPVIPKNIPTVPQPIIQDFTWDRGDHTITVQPRQPADDQPVKPQPPAQPDHAAVGVAATHTTPPYPPIALRQNLEGKVVLKLIVLETGRVGRADIVTSSGSEALDQAAQVWIVAHWAYKPALAGGQPVTSQALASVSFNLKDAR